MKCSDSLYEIDIPKIMQEAYSGNYTDLSVKALVSLCEMYKSIICVLMRGIGMLNFGISKSVQLEYDESVPELRVGRTEDGVILVVLVENRDE